MVIARMMNTGGFPACIGARRQGASMSLTAKRQVTGKRNRRNGPRSGGPVRPGSTCTRRPGRTYEGLRKGTVREFRGGTGEKIKNIVSKATNCMKTLGQLTKCHDEKAKIRRKCGLIFGHFRQFDTNFARDCWFRTGITSDYRLRKTLRRAEGCRADGAGGSHVRAFAGLLFAPHVGAYQYLSEGPAGNSAQKRC